MGRLDQTLPQVQEGAANHKAEAIDAEVEELNARPLDIPADVWAVIQENGRLATEKLHDILASPRFDRLRAGEQAKLIALAQNRAYGLPKSNNAAASAKRGAIDGTRHQLGELVHRATLPEYKMSAIKDAEIVKEN